MIIKLNDKKYFKTERLLDGNGNKLNRKVRLDENGLYVVNNGAKGRLVKTVKVSNAYDNVFNIAVVRKVSHYEV